MASLVMMHDPRGHNQSVPRPRTGDLNAICRTGFHQTMCVLREHPLDEHPLHARTRAHTRMHAAARTHTHTRESGI